MASGASQPGHNVLALDGETTSAGAVGVSLSGAVRIDFMVSQGCRPIGDPLVVTKAEGNVIQELGGRVPMAALKEITLALDDAQRALMNRGLLVGLVIDEYKQRFGRGDFLIRNVTALDTRHGTIAVAERLRVGQTIQFHLRDAETASEDLDLLLNAQQLHGPPYAALLFTCNGRGTRLFESADHDATSIQQNAGEIPAAGFFAAGEIGPVSGRNFLHGFTASVALFDER
jgi:small ligand-binding sensory domain FIST